MNVGHELDFYICKDDEHQYIFGFQLLLGSKKYLFDNTTFQSISFLEGQVDSKLNFYKIKSNDKYGVIVLSEWGLDLIIEPKYSKIQIKIANEYDKTKSSDYGINEILNIKGINI